MFDNVRRVSRQLIAYGTADVSVLAINFLLLPVYTRVLSPDEFGAFTFLLVFEAFLKPVLRCGLDGAFLRHYFDYRSDEERRALGMTVLAFSAALNGVALLVLWPSAPWLTTWVIGSSQYVLALRLVALNTALSNLVFLPLAQFRAEERAALVGTLNFARSFGTTVARLVLVVGLRFGVMGLPLADVAVSAALVIVLARPLLRLARGRFSRPILKDVLRYGLPQVPTGVLSQVMSMSDRPVLGLYLSRSAVGVYSIGSTMASVLKLFPVAFETAWMPFAFSQVHRPDAPKVFARMATYAFTVLAFGALGAALLADPVVRLVLPAGYHDAPVVVPILALGIVLQAGAWFLNTSLNIAKRTAAYPATTAIGALASLAGSLLLVPVWGLRGAALGTVCGQAALLGVTAWIAQRTYRIPYESRRLAKAAGLALTTFAAGLLLRTGAPWTDALVSAALVAAFPIALVAMRFLEGWEIVSLLDALPVVRRAGQFVRHLDRYALKWIFGFDVWHVNRLADRPYARAVIEHLNGWPDTRRGRVAEIGCGLGDIIRRLQFRDRIGLDASPAVVRAASLLALPQRASGLRIRVFSFPSDTLPGRFDAILMVNWPHECEAAAVRGAVAAFLRDHLNPGGAVVIDTVQDQAYRYNHRIDDLTPDGCVASKIGEFARQREVWEISAGPARERRS
jgi:O-antigen/teichoic acid export membrane protein/SAM-dependent methyltransferase